MAATTLCADATSGSRQSRSYIASLLQRVEKLPHHARPVCEQRYRSLNLDLVLPMQTVAAIFLDERDQFDRLEVRFRLERDDGAFGGAVDFLYAQRLASDAQLMRGDEGLRGRGQQPETINQLLFQVV